MAVGCEACFEDRHLGLERAFIDVPQPRYIGKQYWDSAARVVILLINPGAGNGDFRDQGFRDRLRRYRSGDDGKLDDILNEDQAPDWRRFRPFYFRDLALRPDAIAVANVAWCSTKGNRYPKEMLERCFRRHTAGLLCLLRPDVILLSGSPIHRFKTKLEAIAPKTRIILTPHYANREGVAYAEKEALRIRAELQSASGHVFSLEHSANIDASTPAPSKCEPIPSAEPPRTLNPLARITVHRKDYPFRGKRFEIWSMLESGLTVADFSARVKALGAHGNGIGDLQIYLDKGLITLD